MAKLVASPSQVQNVLVQRRPTSGTKNQHSNPKHLFTLGTVDNVIVKYIFCCVRYFKPINVFVTSCDISSEKQFILAR